MSKKTRAFILAIVILFAVSGQPLLAQFAGGDGSFQRPWLIETAEHLNNVRNHISNSGEIYFKQTADIDLGVSPWKDQEGWEPINSSYPAFYDGCHYKISNLYINRPNSDNIGLFGDFKSGGLNNVLLEKANVVGRNNVGALIGFSTQATIDFCISTGVVRGETNVGGIAGFLKDEGGLSDCWSKATVISSSGAVANTGGLVGLIEKRVNIQYSYFRGEVIAEGGGSCNGGIVGQTDSAVNRCYSTAKVIGGDNTGALIGCSENKLIFYSYWDVQTSGIAASAIGEPRTTEQMVYPYTDPDTYKNWDFEEIWREDMSHNLNDGYPCHISQNQLPFLTYDPSPEDEAFLEPLPITLKWKIDYNEFLTNEPVGFLINLGSSNPPSNTYFEKDVGLVYEFEIDVELELDRLYYWQIIPYNKAGKQLAYTWTFRTYRHGDHLFGGGEGVEHSPWIIETAEHLNNIRKMNRKRAAYLQVKDIDLDVSPWNEGVGWEPFGTGESNYFNGVYDGGGYSISGLYMDRSFWYAGLFGYALGATIKNLTIIDANVTGEYYVGALAGFLRNNSKVINCHVINSRVKGSYHVGGLAGETNNSNTSSSSAKIEVIGTGYVGGLLGGNIMSEVENSYCHGVVFGKKDVGGLIGYCSSTVINKTYSVCYVIGESKVGGLIGSLSGSNLEGNYNYWDINRSQQNESVYGEGRPSSDLIYPYDNNAYFRWDFTDVWAHDTEHSLNDGYPYIRPLLDVSIDKNELPNPETFTMKNYPNPFNPETTIYFVLPKSDVATLKVYNVKGQEVKTLINDSLTKGEHRVVWSGVDSQELPLPSGIYFYQLSTSTGRIIQKMMLLK
ncbi:MAG: T9SS type A sorting domain-containing protein [Candidatus Cloacimonas sp.]|nr:T9SS type A sorting domain-containing protein [Candidatus Cloacimonadota bacterium]